MGLTLEFKLLFVYGITETRLLKGIVKGKKEILQGREFSKVLAVLSKEDLKLHLAVAVCYYYSRALEITY